MCALYLCVRACAGRVYMCALYLCVRVCAGRVYMCALYLCVRACAGCVYMCTCVCVQDAGATAAAGGCTGGARHDEGHKPAPHRDGTCLTSHLVHNWSFHFTEGLHYLNNHKRHENLSCYYLFSIYQK